MKTLERDIRQAMRALRARRGSALVVILIMALGIGATTAIFSLVHGVLIRPFPYREPDALVRVETRHAKTGRTAGLAVADLDDLRAQSSSFVDLGAYMSLGGVLGIGVAIAGLRALLALIPVTLPFWMRISVDPVALVVNVVLSIGTGVFSGMAPALSATRLDLHDVLKSGTRGSYRRGRLQGVLVMAEVTISVVLLIGAGLLVQTLQRLQHVDTGFRAQHVWMADVVTYREGDTDAQMRALGQFFHDVIQRLGTLPGVEAVAAAPFLPYLYPSIGRNLATITPAGGVPFERVPMHVFTVSPGYFRVMGIPLLRGRSFAESDTRDSERVTIVSERTARLLWPGQDPIGRQLTYAVQGSPSGPPHTVVGVVGDVKANAIEMGNTCDLYRPFTQASVRSMQVLLQIRGDHTSVLQALPKAIWEVDKQASATDIQSMEDVLVKSIWQRRLTGVLVGVFSIVALVLATMGIYGVMSRVVGQRAHELGIRMAVGARSTQMLALVMRQGMKPVLAGIALGLGLSVVFGRLMSSLLFGISATDIWTFAGMSLLLTVVALLACYLPARRAVRAESLVRMVRR